MNGLRRFVQLDRLTAIARAVLYVDFAMAVGIILYVGLRTFGDVFTGSPPALPVTVGASCESAAGPASACHASVVALSAGRYRIVTDVAAMRLVLALSPASAAERARVLLARVSQPDALVLEMHAGSPTLPALGRATLTGDGRRSVTPIPVSSPAVTTLTLTPDSSGVSVFVLDELGVFEQNRGLLNDTRLTFPWIPTLIYHGLLVPRTIDHLCAFTIVAVLFVPGFVLRRLNPVLLGLICLSLCCLDLVILFSPYGPSDLRLFYATGPVQAPPGGNLNTGLWQGFHLLHGEGLTLLPGLVPWERMPGYGLFCALAGGMFGGKTLLDLAMATVLLQTLFYAAALGAFVWAAGLLWSPPAVWTLGLLVSLLPKQLGYTQVDAIIAPAALLVAAALCVRLNAVRSGRPAPVAVDIFVHMTFALWFVLRPDVVPGWLVVSAVLHWGAWRRLVIPLVLFFLIGIGWGAYKAQYTNQLVLTTSSAGASLFCGLWEVPSRFALTCSDQSYFDWVGAHTPFKPDSNAANSFAVREVLRFWLTYPGHFVIMLDHKIMQSIDEFWAGSHTQLQAALFRFPSVPLRLLSRPRATFLLLTVIAVCVVNGYERSRTLLLGWPLFLNAPLFWVMFASQGRFYSAASIGLLAAGLPPLFERPFYALIAAKPWRTAGVLACACVIAVAAWPFHDWLLQNDAFHYWTPFLDPGKSPLGGFK